jgi:hypothetical protein
MNARWRTRAFALLLIPLLLGGCAGYAGSVKEVRSALLAGDKAGALKMANGALKVKESDDFPKKLKGNNSLLLLERATIKHGLEQFKSASKDFQVADKHLELLDLQNDTMGNIGKWLFSDSVTVYKAPAYEKLLLNTINMLNYLGLGDLEGARVEARRLQVMQTYLANEKSEQAALLGLGSYLAGFAFEMNGDSERALAYYGQALVNGPYPSLKGPIHRLAGCSGHRTKEIEKLLGEAGPAATCQDRLTEKGTVLVVSGVGLAPHKVAKRIPIGMAIAIAGVFLSAANSSQAQSLIGRGLLTWLNFPVMKKTPLHYTIARTRVDDVPSSTESGADVAELVIKAWDSIKGKMMAAAIVRMITRLLAGIAAEQAAKAAGGSRFGSLMAGLAVQGALTVADTPDTRSWVTLPSRVLLTRVELPPGSHEVEIAFEGKGGSYVVKKTVQVPAGGFVVLPVASMR